MPMKRLDYFRNLPYMNRKDVVRMRAGMREKIRTNDVGVQRGRRYGTAARCSLVTLLLVLCLAVMAGVAGATELRIPALKAQSGREISIPLIIDQIGNLAGVKLILHYDKDLLAFKTGNKTQETQSLMHIINDKTPGKLIIVMAGARGIQGKEMPILTLDFTVKKGLTGNHTTVIEVPEVQLMGDDLKEIECKIRVGALTIQP
jgi:hypothetical protein